MLDEVYLFEVFLVLHYVFVSVIDSGIHADHHFIDKVTFTFREKRSEFFNEISK